MGLSQTQAITVNDGITPRLTTSPCDRGSKKLMLNQRGQLMTVNTETILAWLRSTDSTYIDVWCRTKQSSAVFRDQSPAQKAGMQMKLGLKYFTL